MTPESHAAGRSAAQLVGPSAAGAQAGTETGAEQETGTETRTAAAQTGTEAGTGIEAAHAGTGAFQLGIDVGGTSIKAAMVDLRSGQLAGGIHTARTPDAAGPEEVAALIDGIAADEGWSGPVGVALPGVIVGSSLRHAPNLSAAWERDGALDCLRTRHGRHAVLINDADAAGLAELTYGRSAASGDGLTIVLTFGTGIGSALLHNGDLIANSELGGLLGETGRFEEVASGRAISSEALTPAQWAQRAQPFFDQIETMLHPSRWVLGGGLSENFERFSSKLRLAKPMTVAHLGMHAGIVGAAAAACRRQEAHPATEPKGKAAFAAARERSEQTRETSHASAERRADPRGLQVRTASSVQQ